MASPSVSVIIPAYNEAESIGAVVGGVRALYPDFEIIVIDDGSSDRTADAALAAGARVYAHPYNVGNGAAVKSGIREAGGEFLVLMDADGQHNPAEIGKLLAELPTYDMVVGARTLSGQASLGRALGNHIYSRFASYVAKFPIQDLTSGFRAIKADLAKSFLYLLPNTYSYPTTITLGVLRSGRTLKYVPIEVKARKRGSSQIKLIKDGARFFMIIVRICTLYSPMRVFLPVSFSMFLMGLGWYALHLHFRRAIHQHERAAVHDLHRHFHDEPGVGADLPDAIREERGPASSPCCRKRPSAATGCSGAKRCGERERLIVVECAEQISHALPKDGPAQPHASWTPCHHSQFPPSTGRPRGIQLPSNPRARQTHARSSRRFEEVKTASGMVSAIGLRLEPALCPCGGDSAGSHLRRSACTDRPDDQGAFRGQGHRQRAWA